MREIFAIPLSEVRRQFAVNERQDIKIVAPEMLTKEFFELLKSKGKILKEERNQQGDLWQHSSPEEPNNIVETKELNIPEGSIRGNLAISFGNENASQDSHYHPTHAKILYSEHKIVLRYRSLTETEVHTLDLTEGGLIFISPNIVHFQEFHGITLVLEFPHTKNDKTSVEL